MTIETQKHIDPSKGASNPVGLIVRIGVEPKPGDRALDDLAEYSITLSLSQATFLAAAIMTEVAQVQQLLEQRIDKKTATQMKVDATRDSVHASDEPEQHSFSVGDEMPVKEIIEHIVASGFLADISGGKATWSVVSGFPVAVVASTVETKPRLVPWRPVEISQLESKNGVVHLHFNYHRQIDPDIVLEKLKGLKLAKESRFWQFTEEWSRRFQRSSCGCVGPSSWWQGSGCMHLPQPSERMCTLIGISATIR